MFNSSLRKDLAESETKRREAEAVVDSIKASIATIEFTPDGIILDANPLFLKAVGYSLDEIVGKHHKLFCAEYYVNTSEYQQFWRELKQGQAKEGKFPRVHKNGQEIWLDRKSVV